MSTDPYAARRAVFRPRNRATLRPELVPAIGREMDVWHAWTAEAGTYAGQRIYLETCEPGTPAAARLSRGRWIPEEDLEFCETHALAATPAITLYGAADNAPETLPVPNRRDLRFVNVRDYDVPTQPETAFMFGVDGPMEVLGWYSRDILACRPLPMANVLFMREVLGHWLPQAVAR